MILPDVNILLYAHMEVSEQHDKAKAWFEATISNTKICFTWQTIMGFVRISTNDRIFSSPFSLNEAFFMVESWFFRPTAILLTPGKSHLDIVKKLGAENGIKGPHIMDAHLAAVAIEHKATLATNDRDFRIFNGLRLINPLTQKIT